MPITTEDLDAMLARNPAIRLAGTAKPPKGTSGRVEPVEAATRSLDVEAAMSEKELLANVRELAKALKYFVYHTHDSRHSESGFPDLVLLRDDKLHFIELKSAVGRFTEPQKQWLGALRMFSGIDGGETVRGFYVHVWRPSNWFDGSIERALK